MPLEPPRLDDRSFEDLVREVRRRIPTFTPEWTNHNDSDPGMTLAQLFAFMTEHLLFQLDQVPDKGLVTFLRMVGAELHPATPAIADVTLSGLALASGPATPFVIIDADTPIESASPPPGEKKPIRFETAAPLAYLRARLHDIVSVDCEGNITHHAAANRALTSPFAPLGTGRSLKDEMYFVLELDSDEDPSTPTASWPAGTFAFRVNVADSLEVGDPAPLVRTSPVPPRIRWSFASGSRSTAGATVLEFRELTPAHDSTDELTRSGYLRFRFEADAELARAPAGVDPAVFASRFVLRATVARTDAYGVNPPRLSTVRLNTVPAHQLTTVRDEPVGSSTGLPFQRFQLAHAPVAVGSAQVEVTTPSGDIEVFAEADDLFAAGPRERVFALLPATGEILFGDGTFGAIPAPDASGVGGNLTARYRYGGGAKGNVGARALAKLLAPSEAGRFDATNLLAAIGGTDEEGVTQGVLRAPAVVRSRYRAVSEADFVALAKETPNVRVARATVVRDRRPGLCPGSSPGAVSVILVPFAPYEQTRREPIRLPSHIASAVLAYLEPRRLVTTPVFVEEPVFRTIEVDATVAVLSGGSLLDTRAAALEAMFRHFHPLVGGDGLGWPFGGTVEHSSVFERLLGVPGVSRVDELKLRLDGGPWLECEDLPIASGQLLVSGEHVVRIAGVA